MESTTRELAKNFVLSEEVERVKPRFANEAERKQHAEMIRRRKFLREVGSVVPKKQVAPALGAQEQRALFRKLVNMNFKSKKTYYLRYQDSKQQSVAAGECK